MLSGSGARSDAVARILYLVIGENKPSTRKRVMGSVSYIIAAGHTVDVKVFPSSGTGQAALVATLPFYDLVVLQKKLVSGAMLAMMTKANPRLVYDFDDAVMFHELERGEALTGKHFTRFCRIAAACKGVIAGNGYLAEFAVAARCKSAGGAGMITLPTPVDTDVVKPKEYHASDKVVVGWMGTKGNLPHLTAILPAIKEAFAGHPGSVLRVVSDADPGITGIPCEFKAWNPESEANDLAGFDIGVMPLADDIWTRGKGGYKLLQYMASGVPAVASPVGINRDIIQHGKNGLLAGDMKAWSDSLMTLVADAALRERLGRAGRAAVERDYSLGEYNRKLLGFLERFL